MSAQLSELSRNDEIEFVGQLSREILASLDQIRTAANATPKQMTLGIASAVAHLVLSSYGGTEYAPTCVDQFASIVRDSVVQANARFDRVVVQ